MLRPRFSIRTLLVVVTLAGAYFGCWELTKRWGLEPDSTEIHIPAGGVGGFDASPGPFVVSRERIERRIKSQSPSGAATIQFLTYREYHVWLFGYTAKLPFQRELPPETRVLKF